MAPLLAHDGYLLVLDSCGERASVALFLRDTLVAEKVLEERAASTVLLRAVREILEVAKIGLGQLGGVGVVSGPGSFTGVRVGVAMAKGLCEAARLPVAAVSRLAVLGQAAGLGDGFALLDAGRGQVYVARFDKGEPGREFIAELSIAELCVAERCVAELVEIESQWHGAEVAVTTPRLAQQMAGITGDVRVLELSARHALGALQACFAAGGSDLATLDGNYVRAESAIYGAKAKGKIQEPVRPLLA